MNCKKAQSFMLDALYGELPPSKEKALRKHMDSCEQCADEFAGQRATVSSFQQVDFENPPATLTDLVREMAIKEMEQEALFAQPRRKHYWKPALASAAAAILVAVGIYYYLPQAQMNREVQVSSKMEEFSPASGPVVAREADEAISVDKLRFEEAEPPAPLQKVAVPPEAPASDIRYQKMNEKQERVDETPLLNDIGFDASSGAGIPASTPVAPAPSSEKRQTFFAQSPSEVGAGGDAVTLGRKEKDADLEEMPHAALRSAMTDSVVSGEGKTAAKDLLIEGNRLRDNREFEQAAEIYREISGLTPETEVAAEALFRLGQIHQERGDYDQAVRQYQEVVVKHPDFPELGSVYIAAGDCYLALGQHADAVRSYETARDEYPEARNLAIEKLLAIAEPSDSPPEAEGARGENQ